jgi:anti-sigma factor ChrR (cupin superfamily)
MSHVVDSLWEYALGTLAPAEQAEVRRHVRECASCATHLRDAEEAVALVALDLPPETPSPEVFDRLMQSTQGRYEGLVDKLARMWDLGHAQIRGLLEWMKTAQWEPSGIPGVDVLHVQPGPAVAHADAGFVRFAAGLEFPFHDHIGHELQLIMDGDMTDNGGVTYRVGDSMSMPVGSHHSFVIGADGCLIALSLAGGIVINGVKYAVKN